MAVQLKVHEFKFDYDGDQSQEHAIEFQMKIMVGADGEFYGHLPEKALKFLESLGVEPDYGVRGKRGVYFADTMDKLITRVEKTFENACSRKKVSEKVIIRYSIQTSCTYMIFNKEFFPNGAFEFVSEAYQKGKCPWINGTIQDKGSWNHAPFGFTVYTEVVTRTEYQYKNKKRLIKYEHWDSRGDECDVRPNLYWLANITQNRLQEQVEENKLMELDATEEIADFFKQVYISIFSINEKIKDILSPKDILKIIAEKGKLLGK